MRYSDFRVLLLLCDDIILKEAISYVGLQESRLAGRVTQRSNQPRLRLRRTTSRRFASSQAPASFHTLSRLLHKVACNLGQEGFWRLARAVFAVQMETTSCLTPQVAATIMAFAEKRFNTNLDLDSNYKVTLVVT